MRTKIFFFIICLFISTQLSLFGQLLDFIPGEVIVQLKSESSTQEKIKSITQKFGKAYTVEKELYPEMGIYLLSYDPAKSVRSVISDLERDRNVLYVQKNHQVSQRTTQPNDPFFLDQWYHNTIDSELAWDVTTGGKDINGREIVLAVMDSGFDIEHEDIAPNLWFNVDEIPNDGVDNDNNGFIDDHRGWNFVSNNDVHNSSGQGTTHGTNVAGVAGARGDNDDGIAGVSWDVKLLFLSVRTTDQIISGYCYISETRKKYNQTDGKEGAFIVASNISLGIRNGLAEDNPIWCSVYDKTGENGILNVCAVDNLNSDVDINGDMPTVCTSDYLITVTNTDINNLKAPTAAFGEISVDIGAPGDGNFTTSPNNNYNFVEGTSVSSPLVAGAIALLYSAPCQSIADKALTSPGEIALNMKNIIFSGASSRPSLQTITSQGSVLNVSGSIQELDRNCESSGIQENSISILQNPIEQFTDDIIIDYMILQEGAQPLIQVFDVKGALILERQVTQSFFGSNRIRISTESRLTPGIYLVSLMLSDRETLTEKLLVY